jgi:hypothetical protein
METESQNKLIRQYLESGKSLTPLDALHKFNCFRLSGRIYDLRKQGMRIIAETVEIISGGKKKHVTKYMKAK